MKEIEVELEKDSFQKIVGEMTEAVIVDLDQFQELVLIVIGSDVINVENMIIMQKTVQHQNWRRKQNKYNKCTLWMKNRHHLRR